MQPRIHQREPRRSRDRLDELRLLAQRRIVDEDGERLSLVLDQRHRALRTVLGNDEAVARRIHVVVELRQPEPDLERRVLERERELVAQIVR